MREIVLSNEQQAAVSSNSKAIVVSACAGSGKTEVIAHRIERILTTTSEEDFRVLAVSYTVKAADELRERLAERLGGLHRRVHADTIHGFALSLLRQFGTRLGLPPEPEIFTRTEDRVELLEQWLQEQGESRLHDLPDVFSKLDLARARCEKAPYLDTWRAALSSRGALDYAAVLDRARELLDGKWVARNLRRTYGHVVVDEAQNLTPAQYWVLRGVIGEPLADHLNAMLVGDERQSIVGFAGADPRLISRFADEYRAQRIELHTNYRSAGRIVAAATSVARALGNRRDDLDSVHYPAEGSLEIRTAPNERHEGDLVADWVASLLNSGLTPKIVAPGETTALEPEDIAILGRTTASLRYARDALSVRKIEWAEGSTEDEWVASTAARVAIDIISFRSAPDHLSVRRRLSVATGVQLSDWADLSEILASSSNPNLRTMAALCAATSPEEFIAHIDTLEIREQGWSIDVEQLKDSWNSFIDQTGSPERTFGNFRQHIFRLQRGNALSPGVRVLTIHKAQGREFKAVALVACNDGQFPDFRADTRESQEAELRTFYVAVSRASRLLLLTRSIQRETRYGPRKTEASRFLNYVYNQSR